MERHPLDLTTDEEIDEALERAKAFDDFPRIVEAEFHVDAKVEFLRLRLSDDQQMLIPREMLDELNNATAEQVFRALSDEAAKSRWFYGPEGWRLIERAMDFRVGGRERVKGGFEGGVTTTFDAIYHDIVPRERIVYTYEMHLDERRISVSLATLEIEPLRPGRTKLKVCEQGAFLDGYDDVGKREHGTGDLLDKLGASLKS